MTQNVPASQRLFGLSIFGVSAAVLAVYSGVLPFDVFPGREPEDKVVQVRSDDADMLAARNKAQATLSSFWAKHDRPGVGEDGFALKLAIRDGENVEHMWCGYVEGTAGKSRCRISNEPETVKTVTFGQTVDVDPAIISDWMYMKDGKIKGGQTIRVLVARMPDEEAETYRKLLAEE